MIIGANKIFIGNLPSTNSYASLLLRDKTPVEGTIIQTNWQSAGKGYLGNKWESEEGKNLLISIIIFPTMVSPSEQFILSMGISTGICDFLKRYVSGYSIKWPNDIYINNDKIAGILIENSVMGNKIESSVAGIGFNINQEKFLSDAPNPVSLKLVTGVNYDLAICLDQLASDIDKRYKQIIAGDYSSLRNEYFSNMYRFNKWFDFHDSEGTYSGRILSVSDSGRLQIERKSGNVSEYSFREVEFIL
jgi:BirA family biotin operon repressor/biotin-[acetyl-CoA-carboxylase] ligase